MDYALFGALIFTLPRLGLSTFVTVHVLLTRNDPIPSAGWIAIAWLSPFMGSLLYWLLGINRVQRRAQRLRKGGNVASGEAGHFPSRLSVVAAEASGPLVHALHILTGRPLLGGNRVRVLHNGEGAYPAMLAAIAEAQRSILLGSYIFRYDRIGRKFVEALEEARRRGVEIRVLVDGVGGGYFRSPIITALGERKIPAARYMHSFYPWRMPFINLRNHRKLLIVDGRTAYMGGMNIGEENLAKTGPVLPVSDTHFEIAGCVVRQLSECFARDWQFTTKEYLEGETYFPASLAGETADIPMRLITSGPDADVEKLELALLQALTQASRHVRILTPYFVPGPRLVTQLQLTAQRGVKVDLVFSERTNLRFMDYARNASLKPLLEAGCRIWFASGSFNHSKLFTMDGIWSCVGSANLDSRSLRLNFEVNLEVYDAGLAGRLESYIDRKRSQRLTLRQYLKRPPGARLRDAAYRLFLPYL